MTERLNVRIDEVEGYVTVTTLIEALTRALNAGQISGTDHVYVDGGAASGYLTRPGGFEGAVDIA